MSEEWNNATPAETSGSAPADFKKARRRQATLVDPNKVDRLSPHSIEAEQGVLGCVLLAPMETLPKARKRLPDGEGREFYHLPHREIWLTLCRMYDDRLEGKPVSSTASENDGIDLITIQQRLKDFQKLDEVGGLAMLASLPDKVPSAANVDYYLEIVAEKFAVRQLIGTCTDAVSRAYEWPGQIDHLVHQVQDRIAVVARLSTPPEAAERMYLRPGEFGDEHWDRWFGVKKGVPGLPLPEGAFGPDFPFLMREAEFTLLFGEKGMGKSTIAQYITLHLLPHWKAVYDSREVHRVETLKKFVNQLLGVKELERTEDNERLLARAVKWLHSRLLINRSTGIKHWRDILDCWAELAEQGYRLFVLDNLMRIGIAEDDFDGQRAAVTAMSTFAIDHKAHVILINHSNKGNEGDYRRRSAGHHSVVDNCHNVCEVVRNARKWEKLYPWLDMLKAGTITHDEFEDQEEVKKFKPQYDAKFYVHAQRLDGTRQNAARELWFVFGAGQYFDHRHPMPEQGRNWLERWTAPAPKPEDVAENFPGDEPSEPTAMPLQEVMTAEEPQSRGDAEEPTT